MTTRSAPLACLWAFLLVSCLSRSPVGTEYVGPDYKVLEESALFADKPSARTTWVLQLLEAEDVFRNEPRDVLEYLFRMTVEQPRRNSAFVLAELSYLAGKRSGDPDLFLLAAVSAFTFLEGASSVWGERPSPYGRSFRWACEIYNRAISRAFPGDEPGTLELVEGKREFPGGTAKVSVDTSHFGFEQQGLELLIADQRRLRGLNFRMRDSGLGAPLIAVVQGGIDTTTSGIENLDRTSVSATAFLRIEGDLRDARTGLAATLELHTTSDLKTVDVRGRRLPLETDQSATIAYGTELAGYWRHDLRGLFQGKNAARSNGLVLPRPYQRGRIPIVLVHGTASSPTYWAELLNVLNIDPAIRDRYQFWLFIYTTGNPIAYSAATLRRELEGLLLRLDPNGEDAALSKMILIGHSQGGLLIKMLGMTMDADEVLSSYTGKDLDQVGLDEEDQEMVRDLFDIKPSPFVERMIFISTPHRGSFLAQSWFARTLARMIAVPGDLFRVADKLRKSMPEEKMPKGMKHRVSTSLDNMNPNSPFVAQLLEAKIDSRIKLHSIISIGDAKKPEGADDGVVTYESAHLDGVESELLVPSGHSSQSHPRTLLEIRRILYEHLKLKAVVVRPDWREADEESKADEESAKKADKEKD